MPGEVGPVGVSPETLPPVSLLPKYGDKEVTLYGWTGTLCDLASIGKDAGCIDLDDPANIDIVNRVVVKTMILAGQEFDHDDRELVEGIAEQECIDNEIKFVAPRTPENADRKEPTESDNTLVRPAAKVTESITTRPEKIPAKADLSLDKIRQPQHITGVIALHEIEFVQASKVGENDSLSHKSDITVATPAQQLNPGNLTAERPTTAVAVLNETNRATLDSSHDQSGKDKPTLPNETHYKVTSEAPGPSTSNLDIAGQAASDNRDLESPTELPQLTTLEESDVPGMPYDNVPMDILELPQEGFTVDTLSEDLPEPNQEKQEVLIEVWEAELVKEPLTIYEDFTDSLAVFISSFDTTYQEEAGDNVDTALPLGEIDVMEECPAIVIEVFDRLQEVDDDEKVQLGEALKEISGAVHGLHILEARSAPEEIKTEVEQQLEALCASLFDRLGIEYDEVAVRQFTMVMRHKAFSPALHQQTGEIELYLENIGTHEAKYFRREVRNDITQVSRHLIQALGTFVLTYAHASAAA